MAEVFLVETGQLTNASKVALRKAGVVVAEVEDITRAQFIRSSETISGDDMLWAALEALNLKGEYGSKGEAQRERLAANLFKVLMEQRSARPKPAATTREDSE